MSLTGTSWVAGGKGSPWYFFLLFCTDSSAVLKVDDLVLEETFLTALFLAQTIWENIYSVLKNRRKDAYWVMSHYQKRSFTLHTQSTNGRVSTKDKKLAAVQNCHLHSCPPVRSIVFLLQKVYLHIDQHWKIVLGEKLYKWTKESSFSVLEMVLTSSSPFAYPFSKPFQNPFWLVWDTNSRAYSSMAILTQKHHRLRWWSQ